MVAERILPREKFRFHKEQTSHQNTIKILHTLRPVGVVMAGKDVVDPYKD